MHQLLAAISLMCLLPALSFASALPAYWDEVKDAEGIRVYLGQIAGDPIPIVKTEVVIEAELARVEAVLRDEGGQASWVPYLAESRRLQTSSRQEALLYNHFAAPWPAADRDFVFRVTKVSGDERSVTYRMRSEDSRLMPRQRGVVRALLKESTYILTAVGERQTHVEFIFQVDPRGWVPLWITNIIHRAFPFNVLKSLREQVVGGMR